MIALSESYYSWNWKKSYSISPTHDSSIYTNETNEAHRALFDVWNNFLFQYKSIGNNNDNYCSYDFSFDEFELITKQIRSNYEIGRNNHGKYFYYNHFYDVLVCALNMFSISANYQINCSNNNQKIIFSLIQYSIQENNLLKFVNIDNDSNDVNIPFVYYYLMHKNSTLFG